MTDTITKDPVRIRALAHPVRLALLDVLDDAGPATATQCAEATGESVANCSYHLRLLARHGFIERAEGSGRDRPWRSVSTSRTQSIDPDVPGSVHAVAALAGTEVRRQYDRVAAWLEDAPTLPIDEVLLSCVTTGLIYATPQELATFREQLIALTAPFEERRTRPDSRPGNALPARFFAVLNVDPTLPRTSHGQVGPLDGAQVGSRDGSSR